MTADFSGTLLVLPCRLSQERLHGRNPRGGFLPCRLFGRGVHGRRRRKKTAEGGQVAEGGKIAEGGNLSKIGSRELSISVFCVEFHEEGLGKGPEA